MSTTPCPLDGDGSLRQDTPLVGRRGLLETGQTPRSKDRPKGQVVLSFRRSSGRDGWLDCLQRRFRQSVSLSVASGETRTASAPGLVGFRPRSDGEVDGGGACVGHSRLPSVGEPRRGREPPSCRTSPLDGVHRASERDVSSAIGRIVSSEPLPVAYRAEFGERNALGGHGLQLLHAAPEFGEADPGDGGGNNELGVECGRITLLPSPSRTLSDTEETGAET